MSRTPMIDTLEARQLFSATAEVVGYFPDWNASDLMIHQVDFKQVDQLNYFSVIPDPGGYIPGSRGEAANSMTDGVSLSRLKATVAAARAENPNIDISIVIGGAGERPTKAIEAVMGTAAKRNAFAQSVKQFCRTYELDGVDIDYEPPGDRGATDLQIANYGKLIKAVNQAAPALEVSSAVAAETIPTWKQQVSNGQPVVDSAGKPVMFADWSDRRYVLNAEAVRNLDQIGVMAYDFTPGAGNSEHGRSFAALNDWGTYVKQIEGSAAKKQLRLGVPFYGRAGNADWGSSDPSGMASYGDIVTAYARTSYRNHKPFPSMNQAGAAVANAGGPLDGQWATWHYDGPDMIARKAEGAVTSGSGGVMIWDLTQDYFEYPGAYNNTHSLMPAVTRGIAKGEAAVAARKPAPKPAAATPTAAAAASLFSTTPIAGGRAAGEVFGPTADPLA